MTGSGHWQRTTPRAVIGEPPVELTLPPSVALVWPMLVAVGVLTAGGVLAVVALIVTQEKAYGTFPSIRCQRQMMPAFVDRFAPVHPLRVEPAPRIVEVEVAHRLSATTRSVEACVK